MRLPLASSGYLVVHHDADDWGSSAERVVPLNDHEITIGRSPGCSIPLERDILVSRHHAIIRPVGAEHVLIDLGSINGTLVNGEPITNERPLHEGDVIRVGECEIIYSAGSPPVEVDYDEWAGTAGSDRQFAQGANSGFHQSLTETPTQPPAFVAAAETPVEATAETPIDQRSASDAASATMTPEPAPQPPATAPEEPVSAAPIAAPIPDLGLIQQQVANMVEQLRRQAEAEAREAERLRAEIAALQTTLATLLEAERQAEAAGPNLAALIEVTERTVASPRHLDNVIEFAGHVTEIDTALRALAEMRSGSGLIAVVDSVRARLEALS